MAGLFWRRRRRRKEIRVVVAGDRGTGKSGLISAVASESFPQNVARVLPPTRLPADFFPDDVPLILIDTSSSLENRAKLIEELKRADVIVLTYACDQPTTLDSISSFWFQELRKLKVIVPVIVVGCKLDLRDDHQHNSLEHTMSPLMQEFREIETCIECSAATLIQVPEVFYFAQKAVLHPTAPLFDRETQNLKPKCVRALKRIFICCDQDVDGVLNDKELNEFQIKSFSAPLRDVEIESVKKVVQEKLPEGVNHLGLTLRGFIFLHALFIEKGHIEMTWCVLRKFGYDDELKISDDFVNVSFKRAPDQTVELTNETVEFLSGIFRLFDRDNDGVLRQSELEELFSTSPESPWDSAPCKDAGEKTATGGLPLRSFLSLWALMTLLDPLHSLKYLLYVGYVGDPASALTITRKRSVDQKKRRTKRNVFRCLVLGPKSAGKSTLLNSFIRRPFSYNAIVTGERFATNMVDQIGGMAKTLILQEIPEDDTKKLLSNKNVLASYDVAAFIYDKSNNSSWKAARDLLEEVSRKGELGKYGVPCMLISSKDDLLPWKEVEDATRICEELKMEAPISISFCMEGRDTRYVFDKIVRAAERPHMNIPETEDGRRSKQYRQFVSHSALLVSVGAAIAFAGMATYRVFAARRNI